MANATSESDRFSLSRRPVCEARILRTDLQTSYLGAPRIGESTCSQSIFDEAGDLLRHVYFPVDCTVSLLSVMENGKSAEISVVGNDGVIGVALFIGGETTPSRAVVQSAGHAYKLDSQKLKDEFHRNGGLQVSLLRYTQALITQMSQTAVYNRHHSVDQQLCRWLAQMGH